MGPNQTIKRGQIKLTKARLRARFGQGACLLSFGGGRFSRSFFCLLTRLSHSKVRDPGAMSQHMKSTLIFQSSYIKKVSEVIPKLRRPSLGEAKYAIDFVDEVTHHIHDDVSLVAAVVIDV